MTPRCIGEPVSWLRLELHHLGENDAAERAKVDGHMAACPACRACLAFIEHGNETPLPALKIPGTRQAPFSRPRGLVAFGAAAVSVAVLVLAVRRLSLPPADDRLATFDRARRIKGGEVALSLVRDDGERVVSRSGVYRDGDRFKAIVTCPPSLHAAFDLVVFDEKGASFPFGQAERLVCANDVPLSGAFRLTGQAPERVCVAWGEDGEVDRTKVAEGAWGEQLLVCIQLSPVPRGEP